MFKPKNKERPGVTSDYVRPPFISVENDSDEWHLSLRIKINRQQLSDRLGFVVATVATAILAAATVNRA